MIRLFLGRKERGKTTLAVHCLAQLPRRLSFDPRGLLRRPGALIARSRDSFRAAMDSLEAGDVPEVVYHPHDDHRRVAFPVFAAEVKRWIQETPDRSLGVFVDEITFVDISEPDFEWSLKSCRAQHTHFFLTCHRPADVPTTIRALADYWYIFETHQEHDLEVIEKRCSPETAIAAERLRGSEFVLWDDRTPELTEYLDRSAWFVDLAPGAPLVPPIDLDP